MVCCVAIVALGSASGWLANSGYGNGWFDALLVRPRPRRVRG